MARNLPDLSSLRPAGSKHSSKRDRVLSVFLRQEGHLSADDLCDLVHLEDPGIGRATVYRTLQWMVGAGIARKVNFGEGRARFEPSYRHPRHFHLVCTECRRSSEFLSSDIESLLEEVALARNFQAGQAVVQVSGVCDDCRTGVKTPPLDGTTTERVFARDALRIAIATERSGLEFYTRASRLTTDPRGREVFERLAEEEKEHLGTLEKRYAELLADDEQLESRPTFLFFKGAAHGIFAEGAEKLRQGRRRSAGAAHRHQVRARIAPVLQALRRALRRFRGQADLPRVRGRRARAPRAAHSRVPLAAASVRRPSAAVGGPRLAPARPVDRPSHPHHRIRRPVHAGRARRPCAAAASTC